MSHVPTLDELVGSPAQRSPQAEKETTRLPAAPVLALFGNQPGAGNHRDDETTIDSQKLQVTAESDLAATIAPACQPSTDSPDSSAGYRDTSICGNRMQVLMPQETPDEIRQQLANLGVNLAEVPPGCKHVFDDFMQGRLVSLLAMGLSIRQAAAALGVSHVAVGKVLRRNPELTEQVNAARFQAQIEPLLVVLRESKRNWRAATWLMNYLNKSVAQREETPEEIKLRQKEERDEFFRDPIPECSPRQNDYEAPGRKSSKKPADQLKKQREPKQAKRAPADTVRSLAEEMAAFLGVNPPEPGSAK